MSDLAATVVELRKLLEEAPHEPWTDGRYQWRTGRKVGRTLYSGDKLIGVLDSPLDADLVVAAVNALPSLLDAVERGKSAEGQGGEG